MSYVAAEIEAAGASLVAVSPQTEKQAFFMHDQHKLAFPLLVDAHNQLARQFGLVYRVPEEEQGLYRSTFVNLPFANGDDSWELPIPATFVVDRDGSILFCLALTRTTPIGLSRWRCCRSSSLAAEYAWDL